ncbi:PREDICTED: cytosolic phospholipase A2 beta-like [Crocodylus porosus]|uniref:cytosolic phospholipase A2 beta-like n=1 Tax=Crocodylus porosus TaxID=8502 RepID=UPI00093E50F4|nr:PREDICTED: cytosolic phospholipase A2 beta-like [Crocodylus porosus]
MGDSSYKTKSSSNCLLSVGVIRARNITSRDLATASDCYVSLWLPTASNGKFQTQTIENSNDPVWNETFYFRIQTEVKNILELTIFDKDLVTKDDIQFTVLFDVANVRPGVVAHETFSLKSEKQKSFQKWESLEVEFKMEKIPGPPESLSTNGVLVSREMCCLEVQVEKEENKRYLKENKNVVLTVHASYEGTQKTTTDVDTFHFHCIKRWEPILKARLQKISDKEKKEDNSRDSLTVPLKLLPVGQKMTVGMLLEDKTELKLHLQVNDCSENLDVRLGYDLCADEQEFLHKRKKVVANALKKVLQLKEDLHEHEVPVIAVMTSGGGLRAMTSMYGHLSSLQKLNLLNCTTYITGTSGSTWTMTDLYGNSNWSEKTLEGPLKEIKKQVTKCKLNIISIERLNYYHKELIERVKEGLFSSFTALWALIQEMFLHDEPNKHKLTDERQAVDQGQNPLPFYVALNVKDEVSTFKFREWVEFSPYEVGFPKYGAFIRSENFDSEFYMGRLVKKFPESRICYLEGLWTNVFTRNLLDGLFWSSNPQEFWDRWAKDMIDMDKENSSDIYSTVIKPPPSLSGKLCEIFEDIMTKRPLLGETHNFLKGLEFHKGYFQQKEFTEWKDTVLDASPNQLTPLEKHLCLIDVGYFVNTSCPPLLRPERNVDVIISLDYSLGGFFKQLQMVETYCKVQKIPFPKIEVSEEDQKNPKECYIFSDAENLRAPTLIHFPLVNDTFKEYKEPGVKRNVCEMKEGKVNLENCKSPYYLTKLQYSSENFDKLVNLSSYNILNNKDLILQCIQSAMEKKRKSRRGGLPSTSRAEYV